jgi:HlyD family secretion protein
MLGTAVGALSSTGLATVLATVLVAACGSAPSVPPVTRVQRGNVGTTVSASGALAAVTSQNLGFPNGAQLTELAVRVGDQVQPGQVLAKLDPFAFQQALNQQQAQLSQQQALLAGVQSATTVPGARATLDQAKKVLDATRDNVDAQHDADNQATDSAKRQLDFAQAQLDQARRLGNDCVGGGGAGGGGRRAARDGGGDSGGGFGGDFGGDFGGRRFHSSSLVFGGGPGSGLVLGREGHGHGGGDGDGGGDSGGSGTGGSGSGGSGSGGSGSGGSGAGATGGGSSTTPSGTTSGATPSATPSAPGMSASSTPSCATAQANVISAQAAYNAAKSREDVDSAQGRVGVENTRQNVVTAQNTLDSANAQRPSDLAAQAALVANQTAAVAIAQRNLNDTVLYAPVAGTVSAINGTVGEFLGGSSSGTTALAPGTDAGIPGVGAAATSDQAGNSGSGLSATHPGGNAFIVLNNVNTFQVVVPFEESDAAKVARNQPVELTFDAIPDLTEQGTVLSIAPDGTNISGVTNFYATIVLNHTDPRLRGGLTAEASVQVSGLTNVLVVPNSAVIRQGSEAFVNVPGPDGRPVRQQFQPGIVGDDRTQVVSGLAEGQPILLPQARPALGGGRHG